MRIPEETFGVSLTADEIELLLNAISYEKAENSGLTDDYKQELLLLFRKLSDLIQEV